MIEVVLTFFLACLTWFGTVAALVLWAAAVYVCIRVVWAVRVMSAWRKFTSRGFFRG